MAEREILFRGKRTYNGRWIYGSLVIDSSGNTYIVWEYESCKGVKQSISSKTISVIPSTVGQYTGLCDKNGVKIFERDIIKTVDGRIGVVHYSSEKAAFVAKNIKTYKEIQHWTSQVKSSEVIGNIHDNPELLENSSP